LYSPRQREANVALLLDVLSASDERPFREALERLVEAFHPSVLAEIDHGERTVEAPRRNRVANYADGLI
jgi:hypothetical protein